MGQDKQTDVRALLATEFATTPINNDTTTFSLPNKIFCDLPAESALTSSGGTTASYNSVVAASSNSSSTSDSSDSSSDSSPSQSDTDSHYSSSLSASSPPFSHSLAHPLVKSTSASKILLFHPSIISPSNARKLEDVRNVTVLYNPKSGNKRGGRIMFQAVSKFKRHGLEVNTVQLEYKGHATDYCKNRPDFEDIDVLCVVGGDGTFHEVVNGLMQHPLSRVPHCLPVLSVVPAGTGNSMVRELQGISSVRVSTDELLFGTAVAIDVLKVTILSVVTDPPMKTVEAPPSIDRIETPDEAFKKGEKYLEGLVGGRQFIKKEVIYAFNSIHWGLASRVLEKAEKMRWMGHGIRYTAAALMEMLQGSSTNARVILEDAHGVVTEYENDTFCLLIANNIGTAGKGMTMAPKAKINDGLVDLLLIRSHKPWHLMKIFEKLYSGTHVDLPYVEYKQVRKFSIFPYKKSGDLEVQAKPRLDLQTDINDRRSEPFITQNFAEELVDIDGELKGCTPFECEVIPQAIELII